MGSPRQMCPGTAEELQVPAHRLLLALRSPSPHPYITGGKGASALPVCAESELPQGREGGNSAPRGADQQEGRARRKASHLQAGRASCEGHSGSLGFFWSLQLSELCVPLERDSRSSC